MQALDEADRFDGKSRAKDKAQQAMQSVMKLASGRAFYQRGAVWEDARLKTEGKAARRVAYLSDGYFALLPYTDLH